MIPSAKRMPAQQRSESVTIPAPIGGFNSIDVAGAMPPNDCIYLYNMLSAEYGLRARLGFKEWVTGLTGVASDNTVRSIMPYNGSTTSGSKDKLFAATLAGIWDVATSTQTPSQLVTFGVQSGDAGYGITHAFTTPSERFLLLTDEENGTYVWKESTSAWGAPISGTTQIWQANTLYSVGNKVINSGNTYTCTTAGVSGAGSGPTATGAGVADNTVVWTGVSGTAVGAIGPSLADQNNGYTADPANFAFVTVFKNRVWLVEKNTTRGWYGPLNAVYGTYTSFDFGTKFRAGGSLVGLYNWSYDGGSGIDTLLVAISTGGDVVIYKGTDPSSAASFGLVGTWYVGAVPYGRRIATDYGGEVLILSTLGVIGLSKLVSGKPSVGAENHQVYETAKISNTINALMLIGRGMRGWSLRVHPNDNALVISVPKAAAYGVDTQLVMSFATKGWSYYRDMPLLSNEGWNGQFYFGTTEGRVCVNTGYVDNVKLSNGSFSSVSWSVLTSYQNLGNMRQKRVQMVRPQFLSQEVSPVFQVTVKYNYDIAEPSTNPTSPEAGGSGAGWDSAIWDASLWSGDYNAATPLVGAAGMGRDVAIAVRGRASTRTILTGIGVMFDQGGML